MQQISGEDIVRPHFYMVDVFTERPYSGNPLAVIVGAEVLSGETMQNIASEMNFSETTFVTSVPEDDGGYPVRVFTPSREISFTGHPILGTAWVIRNYVTPDNGAKVLLNLAVGQVPVTFESSADGREVVWFLAPVMSFGAIASREPVAAALGLLPEDIVNDMPIQIVSSGTSAMIVPLCNRDALQRSKLDLDNFAPLAAKGFPPLIYQFCRQTHHPENDMCARFFFEAHGVREDPATGNGAAFLGGYLLEHQAPRETNLTLRIEQGYEIRRPSLVMVRAEPNNGHRNVSVGGYVVPTVQGELL